MNFEPYITYDEYVELGGKAPLDAFSIYERKSQRLLDYITFNRIPKLTKIPDEVKEVLVEFIDKYSDFNTEVSMGNAESPLTQYSNGVETFTYKDRTEDDLKKELYKSACSWLPTYLTFRGVSFDIGQYLQQNGNNI